MTGTLKETHPQKYYLRQVSRLMFYFGLGTYWYEGSSTRYPKLYIAWCIFIQCYLLIIVLDIFLAILRPDLCGEKKSEAIQIGFCQLLILIKFVIIILQRNRIRSGFKKLLEEDRDIFSSLDVEKRSVRTAKNFFLPLSVVMYSYLGTTVVSWTFASILNDTPIQTQVVYFPTAAHTGFPFNLLRVLIIIHWWLHATMMTISDCLCSLPIFFVAAKFKQVQIYFENLGKMALEHWSGEDFKKAVIDGIKLHRNALWCASNIQSAMGTLYGIQISQTIIVGGISLCQLASQKITLMIVLSEVAFIIGVSVLTAAYMINSGVITYEAAAVATSIFHCGWQRVPMDNHLRTVLVVAIHQAQVPVYMTAFGMLNLSHESFVSVLRAAYSLFALMY